MRIDRSRGREHLERRHAVVVHQLELTGILTMRKHPNVSAGTQDHFRGARGREGLALEL